MSSTDSPNSEDLPVRFMPPLALERQRWILETLRSNHARSVLDIGCGEGSLLGVLCNPTSSIPNDAEDKYLSAPIRDLSLTRVAALDIDPSVIQDAVHAATYDREPHYLAPWGSGEDGWYTRWAPLDVAVWLGQLQVLNPTFYGFDAIVSTEVIEHVPDSVLPAFSHILLGQYRPRLLLLTTPNYTFNARFHPPDVPRKGFLDPTGQTTRVFRHSDHKREWTVPEFEAWCREAAETHGYDVTLDGVGVPTAPDPFKRDLGYASQTALFVRRKESETLQLENLSISKSTVFAPSPGPPHQLLAERAFEADPRAGHPQSSRAIRSEMAYVMNMRGEGELTVSEVWSEVAMPCGGSVAALMNALMEKVGDEDTTKDDPDEVDDEDTLGQWSIQPPRNPNYYTDHRWDRVIVWEGFVPEPMQNGESQDVPDEEYEYEDDEEQHWDMEAAQDHANEWEVTNFGTASSATHNIVVVNGWSTGGGWGQDTGDSSSGWGEASIDEAAAIWGPVEPPERPPRH